jgi:hypothetical protein
VLDIISIVWDIGVKINIETSAMEDEQGKTFMWR